MAASPVIHEQRQFHPDGQRSNLDRCDWCGENRSAHGQDWHCPTSSKRGRVPLILLVIGGLFAAVGLIMVTAASGSSHIAQRVNGLGQVFLLGGLIHDHGRKARYAGLNLP
ncbi:MAG TPA: hypothetical protein VGD91_16065 [Trebonia sp.]